MVVPTINSNSNNNISNNDEECFLDLTQWFGGT